MPDYVCPTCGHEYDELGDGKCIECGGNIIPIEEVGTEENEEYPDYLMEEELEKGEEPLEPFDEEAFPDELEKPEEA